jgi:Do/DeqQ family serine protease
MGGNVIKRLAVSCLLVLCGLGGAQAQLLRGVPETRPQIQMSFAPIVKQATPAVVNVYGARVVANPMSGMMGDPLFKRFFEDKGLGDMPRERVQSSLGSGVIVSPDGLIVTNHHVIATADEVKVALSDGREFEADIVLRDQRTDLAILRIKASEIFPTLPLGNSDTTEVGDLVLAIGNPFGVGQTVTSGIVSALARTQLGISDYRFFIQTDAAINPGNSGGALVDMKGQLIGINTAIYSRTGGSVGIGFAIPVNMVRSVVESARTGSRVVRRPWFGARLQKVTADLAESLGLQRPVGALIAGIVPNGPAAKAGLRIGDLILAVDGQEVGDPDAFGFRYATRPLGGEAQLEVLRQGKRTMLRVMLISAPEGGDEGFSPGGRTPFTGAAFLDLSPALAEELRLDGAGQGVVVRDVKPGTQAHELGLQRGDVIRAINGRQLASVTEFKTLLEQRARFWKVTIQRDNQLVTVVVGG